MAQDLICARCGEPWALDHVVHDDPEAFEREGSLITRCPPCPIDASSVSPAMLQRAQLAGVTADLLGDDLDGAAAMLDDAEFLGFMDEEL